MPLIQNNVAQQCLPDSFGKFSKATIVYFSYANQAKAMSPVS